MGPRQEDSELKGLEYDSTLGFPGEGPPRVPNFGSVERCTDCDVVPWRASRVGNAGKVERWMHEKKRHGDGEMQGVCVEDMCDVPQP